MNMILEDFTAAKPEPQTSEIDRAAVFDEGYKEGWKDAAEAIKAEDLRLGASVASHLEGLAHTQQTATALCLAQIDPLLKEIFDKILPRAADRAFLAVVLEEAEKLLKANSKAALTIRVAPEALSPLFDILDAAPVSMESVKIEAEPGLDPMQARVAHPEGEREIDLSRVLDALDDAFEVLQMRKQENEHD
jgi:flagellar assembly protein FliH